MPVSSAPTKAQIVEESLVPLNTTDFGPEVSKISASKPDALFTFMPGGLGINLLNTYIQAGLKGKLPIDIGIHGRRGDVAGAQGQCRSASTAR